MVFLKRFVHTTERSTHVSCRSSLSFATWVFAGPRR